MEYAEIFSIAAGDSIMWDRQLIAARNGWEALDFFRAHNPDYSWNLSMQRGYYKVLVSAQDGSTKAVLGTELLEFAQTLGELPVLAGEQYGMGLFIIAGTYGVIARGQDDAMELLQATIPQERYEAIERQLRWSEAAALRDDPDWLDDEDEEPFVGWMADHVITIVRDDTPVTATVEQHIRYVMNRGMGRAHMLFVRDDQGVFRDPADGILA